MLTISINFMVKERKGELELKEHQAMTWGNINQAIESDILEVDLLILQLSLMQA